MLREICIKHNMNQDFPELLRLFRAIIFQNIKLTLRQDLEGQKAMIVLQQALIIIYNN